MPKNELTQFLADVLSNFDKAAEAETGSTQDASTGARASENTADVKKVVPGTSVDAAADNSNNPSTSGANTPTNKGELGNGSAETGKGVPTPASSLADPGTSHPAKVGGEKNASFNEQINDLLAAITVLSKEAEAGLGGPAIKPTVKPAVKPAGNLSTSATPPVAADTAGEAVTVKKAEYEELQAAKKELERVMGFMAGQQATAGLDKSAGQLTDEQVLQKVAHELALNVWPAAESAADDVIAYLQGAQKAAEDLSALLAGAGGGDPAAAAGGPPPGAVAPDAMAGAGGPPPIIPSPDPSLGGAPAGGAPDLSQLPPEVLQQLLQALMQSGVTAGDVDQTTSAVDGAKADEAGADSGSSDEADDSSKPEGDGSDKKESPKEEPEEESAEKSAQHQKLAASVINLINKVKQTKRAAAKKPKAPAAKPAAPAVAAPAVK